MWASAKQGCSFCKMQVGHVDKRGGGKKKKLERCREEIREHQLVSDNGCSDSDGEMEVRMERPVAATTCFDVN